MEKYNEGIDIEADEYYALLNNSKEFPTTSQPALGEVLELYKSIAEQRVTPSSHSSFFRNLWFCSYIARTYR